jgi:serine/threonine protein kinase
MDFTSREVMLMHIYMPPVQHDLALRGRESFHGCTLADSNGLVIRVGKCVGSGASGSVFEARVDKVRCRYVIKIHHSPDDADELPVYAALGLVGKGPSQLETRFLACHPEMQYLPLNRISDAFAVPRHDGTKVNAYMSRQLLFCLGGSTRHLTGAQFIKIAYRLVWAVQYMHEQGYCHLDLKLENICMDRDGRVYLLDFGCAESFLTEPPRAECFDYLRGNRFSARDLHRGVVCSPRADLESIAFCLLYWLTGSLPWAKLEGTSGASNRCIYASKLQYCSLEWEPEADCIQCMRRLVDDSVLASKLDGRTVLEQSKDPRLVAFLAEIFRLNYVSPPDYDKLRGILSAMVCN